MYDEDRIKAPVDVAKTHDFKEVVDTLKLTPLMKNIDVSLSIINSNNVKEFTQN